MAGEILAEYMAKYGFRKEQFLIINSVNCRPVDGNKNGKPTPREVSVCHSWVRKYLKVVQPEKVLILGNYAKGSMKHGYSGILSNNGTVMSSRVLYDTMEVLYVHPAYCIYNKEDGRKKIDYAINKFKTAYY